MNKLKDKFNKLKNNQDGKVLISNFSYLSLLQIAGYVFPLITIPYLARVIGVDSFGKIAFASAVILWFKTLTDWGFNFTATRDVAKNRDDLNKVSEIFSNVLWAKSLLTIVSFICLLLAIFLIPQFNENKAVLLLTFLLIPGKILFPDWFFQAIERMKYITILNIISKLIFTISIFIFIKQKSDYLLQPLLTSIGYIVVGIISLYILVFKKRIKIHKPNFNSIIATIKESTNVFLNNFVPNLYNSFSIMLLGFFGGSVSNGKLDAGTKFVDTSQQFMNVIGRTFFPYLSRKIDKHDLYVKLNVYLSLFISVVLFIVAPFIIKLFFTPEFYDAINILRLLSITIFFMSVRNAYGTHYLIIMGYEKKLWHLTLICSVIGFVLAFPLVMFYDFWGAAINIALVKALMAVTVIHTARKLKKQERKNEKI